VFANVTGEGVEFTLWWKISTETFYVTGIVRHFQPHGSMKHVSCHCRRATVGTGALLHVLVLGLG